jgi:hypothetical protein
VDWSRPSLVRLMAMMRWLVDEPMPGAVAQARGEARYRSEGTANAIMGTVGEFRRGAARRGG